MTKSNLKTAQTNMIEYKKLPHPIDVLMGSRVRFIRIQHGMSQTDLAKILGLTFQQVQKYEKGANRMGSSRLFEISQALGMTVSRLFEGIETEAGKETPELKKSTTLELKCAQMLSKLSRPKQKAVHRIIKILVGDEG